jgi:5'-nucleotidase
MKKLRILISNDDSIHARGLHTLYKFLKKLGDVWCVAPTVEKSTTGHSLTIHKPLRLLKMADAFPFPIRGEERERVFAASGSPADCVYLGVREVMKGKMPDVVVSGINRGANLGQDVYYSGTVSAAREACIMGIPSIAVSMSVDFERRVEEEEIHYATAAEMTVDLIQKLTLKDMPFHTLLNFNVPDLPRKKVRGIRLSQQGFRYYQGTILKRRDHRGKDYYWVGGQYQGFKEQPGTDCDFVEKGYASITPLKLDSTDFRYLNNLARVF